MECVLNIKPFYVLLLMVKVIKASLSAKLLTSDTLIIMFDDSAIKSHVGLQVLTVILGYVLY